MMCNFFAAIAVLFLLSTAHCFPLRTHEGDNCDGLFIRATTRQKATTVTQSINNWIEDVDTVNSFLNVALALPLGGPLKARASNALAFAQDEPTNVAFLKTTPGIDSAGLAAASELERVFGGVLDQLRNVVDQPGNLAVAISAVKQININRCNNVLPSAETLWRSAATAANISTATFPPLANRETACRR
ncbi:uncharacterized protein PAC_04132 [Phialocephala subalpina]|uniref:Uncharacterized protein n=1 Tax=Phialocephala subalpina TaxID=576137 RepID=A0A1L7WNA4_9HELO|nr:uncharacterized protein PAC_04132 [Phialocephala subalpina]